MTTYLIAGSIGVGNIFTSSDLNSNFTSGTGSSTWGSHADSKNWSCITTSADGTKLAAGIYGSSNYIYTSTNSGVTWTQQNSPAKFWTGIASSGSGTILAACAKAGTRAADYIYTSTDSGVTWTQQTAAGQYNWSSITISSDGTKVAACIDPNQKIVTGVYSGGSWTWTYQAGANSSFWKSITSSSNGNIIYACETNALVTTGNIWKSTNSGVSWTNISPFTSTWFGITTNATGTKVAAYTSTGSVGQIYVSTDSGATFSGPYSGAYRWKSISYSSDGSLLAACVDNVVPANAYIYVSGDDGVTFTAQSTAGTASWSAISVSGPISGACFRESTRILMADRSFKAIKDIERGEEILTDKKTGETKKVARVIRYMATGKGTQIPMHLIGNRRTIVCSQTHPFWISNTRRILAVDIEGVEEIEICEILSTIQFEEEGTYYVEGVKVDAISPDHRKLKLPQELYFDQTKYKANRVMKSEDDQRRKKPNMVKIL